MMKHILLFIVGLCLFSTLAAAQLSSDQLGILKRYDLDLDGNLTLEEVEEWYMELFGGKDKHEDEHDGHDHKRGGEHGHEDHEVEYRVDGKEDGLLCNSSERLFQDSDLNADSVIVESEFETLLTKMFVLVSMRCQAVAVDEHGCEHGISTAGTWLGAIFSAVFVTLMSFVGVLTFPVVDRRLLTKWILPGFLALSVGALVSDALLHLIPHAIGAGGHDHGHGDHGAEEEEEEDEFAYLGPVSMAVLAVIVFYILEVSIGGIHRHNHQHFDEETSPKEHHEGTPPRESSQEEEIKVQVNDKDGKGLIPTVKDTLPVGWMILFSDGLHNITDGLALGVAWNNSVSSGISTTIAIFLHEVPQEFGDFAVLIRSGFTLRQAIGANLLSGATCILGAIIGAGLGQIDEEGNNYLLGFIAGGFLYIALSNLLPFLHVSHDWRKQSFFLSMFLLGYLFMLLIALFIEGQELCF